MDFDVVTVRTSHFVHVSSCCPDHYEPKIFFRFFGLESVPTIYIRKAVDVIMCYIVKFCVTYCLSWQLKQYFYNVIHSWNCRESSPGNFGTNISRFRKMDLLHFLRERQNNTRQVRPILTLFLFRWLYGSAEKEPILTRQSYKVSLKASQTPKILVNLKKNLIIAQVRFVIFNTFLICLIHIECIAII